MYNRANHYVEDVVAMRKNIKDELCTKRRGRFLQAVVVEGMLSMADHYLVAVEEHLSDAYARASIGLAPVGSVWGRM